MTSILYILTPNTRCDESQVGTDQQDHGFCQVYKSVEDEPVNSRAQL